MNYQDFELEISKDGTAGAYVAKVRAPEGQEAKEYFTLPSGIELENLILKMCGSRRSTRAIKSPDAQAACDFGGMLFGNVFTGDIGNIFKSCLDHTTTDSGLRIKLILQDEPELSALPWEFLYDAKKRSFLAHTQKISIVRYLKRSDTIKPLEVSPPFRLLVASASPSDFNPLNLDKEQEELRKAFAKLEHEGLLQVTWLEHTTIEKLATSLEEQQFHVLHFMGHSGFDNKSGESALLLEDERGRGDFYAATYLSTLLQDYDGLRLVVLNSCSGAKQDTDDPYSSIAMTLMLGGIPAVIAMQFDISDQAAIGFAESFYKHLAKGEAVDKAVGEARKYLYAVKQNNVEWGTPVLYLRAKDGVLFNTTQIVKPKSVVNEELSPVPEKQVDSIQSGEDYNAKAREFYEKQDYAEAVKWCQKAAERGNAKGQLNLGLMYHNGYGVKQDYIEAFKWYQKAAEQGNAYGQFNLGVMYRDGDGVKQDYAEAVKWFQKAAEQGDADGQNNLGIMYRDGDGVKQDYAEAVKWYQKAAEQGHANGQYNLGIMYRDGDGVKQDYAEAVKWFQKAAEQGNAYGQVNLGVMYQYGYGVKQDYVEAVKWFQKAAEQGDADGQSNLGFMYDNGYGVKQDYAEAVKWFQKAVEQGDANGQVNLGVMYQYGYGVKQDYAEAVKWFQKAVEQGDANGQVNLGVMYQYGYGVKQDYVEAVKWFQKAAEQGHARGQNNLGAMYEDGTGVAQDKVKALKLYQKAAAQNDELAKENFARLRKALSSSS